MKAGFVDWYFPFLMSRTGYLVDIKILVKKFRTFKNLAIVFFYSRMKNLGPGKSSKLVLKIMKHALAGLAELGVQVVQYLAEIEVTPFPSKNLLLLCSPPILQNFCQH